MPSSPNAAELPPHCGNSRGCNDGVILLSRGDGRWDDCSPGKCGCNVPHCWSAALRDRLSPGTGHPSRMGPVQV